MKDLGQNVTRDADPPTTTGDAERPSPRYAPTLMLVVFWAMVLFCVQEYTTGSNYPLTATKAIGSRVVRFLLDVLACGSVVLLVRGWILQIVLLGSTVSLAVLMVYYEYFGRALTWTTITNHFGEGVAVGAYALDLVRWQSFSLIVAAAIMLVVLARRANRRPIPPRRRVTWGAVSAGLVALLAVISTQYIDPVRKLTTFGTVDRIAMTNGYLLTWYGEWRHLDGPALLSRAMKAAELKQNRLVPVEAPLLVGEKTVILQVESLDFAVVNVDMDDQPVMPFLRELSHRSMFFRISAIHESGSCDADFVMLMNLFPAGDVTPYAVPDFDFGSSLARLARGSGFRSVFVHGNDRSFFNRAAAIGRMGFDQMLFREDLESEHGLTSQHWGISDRDVLAVSSRLLREETGRALHFIITLTSHGPFNFLDTRERELFASPGNLREQYLNSMRYVDTQLRAYIGTLPKGTLIILYGDHSSHVDYGQPPPTRGREPVPLLIHRVGGDLAELQVTRGQAIATSGELTMLDVAGYIWSMFRHATVDAPNSSSEAADGSGP